MQEDETDKTYAQSLGRSRERRSLLSDIAGAQSAPPGIVLGGVQAGGVPRINEQPPTIPDLPAANAPTIQGFTVVANGTGVLVYPGSVANTVPTNMDGSGAVPFTHAASDGDAVYVEIQWDVSGGVVGSVTTCLLAVGPIPADDPANAHFYIRLANVSVHSGAVTAFNSRYSPVDAFPYRNWYSVPAHYAIAMGG